MSERTARMLTLKFCSNCRTSQPAATFVWMNKYREHCAKCDQRRRRAMGAVRKRREKA